MLKKQIKKVDMKMQTMLAVIAYKHQEISVGRCRELTALDDLEIKEYIERRLGDLPPFEDLEEKCDALRAENERLREEKQFLYKWIERDRDWETTFDIFFNF